MRKISRKVREVLELLPQIYARLAPECKGRITWEHCWIYAGKQIDEAWAIIFLCEYHHDVGTQQGNGDLNKKINQWISLNRATDEELKKYSKAVDLIKQREHLNKIYG